MMNGRIEVLAEQGQSGESYHGWMNLLGFTNCSVGLVEFFCFMSPRPAAPGLCSTGLNSGSRKRITIMPSHLTFHRIYLPQDQTSRGN